MHVTACGAEQGELESRLDPTRDVMRDMAPPDRDIQLWRRTEKSGPQAMRPLSARPVISCPSHGQDAVGCWLSCSLRLRGASGDRVQQDAAPVSASGANGPAVLRCSMRYEPGVCVATTAIVSHLGGFNGVDKTELPWRSSSVAFCSALSTTRDEDWKSYN